MKSLQYICNAFAPIFLLSFLLWTICLPALLSSHSDLGSSPHLPRRFMVKDPVPSRQPRLGRIGELMISFLAPDLPFTLFMPSESSFTRMSKMFCKASNMSRHPLNPTSNVPTNGSMPVDAERVLFPDCPQEVDGAFALISRIFGFSVVPRVILSRMVPDNYELVLESLSGYRLYLTRLRGGALIVNNLVCETMDIKRGQIVIHIVKGVIMDSQSEHSLELGTDEPGEEANGYL